ncbi:MAG: hypothetical protein IJY89_00215, partial [Clostridia bacterium]|nr:hypothetical protein [Clostridia bacterium]
QNAIFDDERDIDERLKHCKEYFSLADLTDDYYAAVFSMEENLRRLKEREDRGLLPVKISFGAIAQPVTEKDGRLFLEKIGCSVCGMPNVYLLCGPDHTTAGKTPLPVYDTTLKEAADPITKEELRALPKDQGAALTLLNKGVTVKTPAGSFSNCLLFRYRHGGMKAPVVENYYCPGVGVVKCVCYLKEDALSTRIEEYELTEYRVAGTKEEKGSLLPLEKGNYWCYRPIGAAKYLDGFYKREVLSVNVDQNGQKTALLAGSNLLLFLENNTEGVSEKELFDLAQRYTSPVPPIMREILKNKALPYYKQMAGINLDHHQRIADLRKRHTSYFSYLRKENLSGGKLTRLSPATENLCFSWMVLPETKLSCKELAYLDVFSYAPLFDGRLFAEEWVNGYEKTFKKQVLFEKKLFLCPRDAYQVPIAARNAPEKDACTLDCHVQVSSFHTVTLSNGKSFDNCLRVVLSCSPEKEEVLCSDQTFFLGQLSAEVLCGKRTLFFAPGVGIVQAVAEDGCGTTATVELASDPQIRDRSYLPLYFGCENRYRILSFDDQYHVEWGYKVCLGKDQSHDHLMSTFFLGQKCY